MSNENNDRETRVVINADDFGISDGVCRAILELFNIGAISNTTIMVASYDSLHYLLKWNVSTLAKRAGIHLQLTSGKPVSPPREVPSLVDRQGYFLPKERLVAVGEPQDVETEWRRQIEVGSDMLGEMPTHLDSHHGVHRIPRFFDVYLSIAYRYHIPVRGAINPKLERKRKQQGVKGSSYLIRDWTGKRLGSTDLIERIIEARNFIDSNEIIEVVTHPGYSDSYLRSISSLNDAREYDFKALKEMNSESILLKRQVVLVSYPDFTPVGE